tara:strand:+ start:7489 stop:8064 length:576 start_codon:yes stop_codon:yes gene_type:complete
MPNWKKLLTSGSAGNLSSLTVDNTIDASIVSASAFSGDGSGLSNLTTTVTQQATVEDSFTNQTSVATTHNFGTKNILVNVYNGSDSMIIPASIVTTSTNVVTVGFDISTTGRIVVAKGGHLVSGTVETYRVSVNGASEYTLTHNLDEDYTVVQVYDTDKKQVIPADIESLTANSVKVTFDSNFTGNIVVKK